MRNKKLAMLILAGLTSVCVMAGTTGCAILGTGNNSSIEEEVKTVTLSAETFSLVEYATAQLTAEVSDGSAVVWTTSDASVVSISEEADGSVILTGVKVGTAIITATSGNATAECVVTVTASAYQPSMVADFETVELTTGKSATVNASVSFKGQSVKPDSAIVWTINDSTIATIEDKGDGSVKVTAVKPGDAILKATSSYKGKTVEKSIPIYVNEDIEFSMTSAESNLYVWNGNGKYAELPVTAQLAPVVKVDGETVDSAAIVYTTDEDFVTVSENGLVTAVSEGEVRITATYTSAAGIEYKAHCDIVVHIPEINLNKTAEVYILAEDGDKVIDIENEVGLDSTLDYTLIDESTGEELAYTTVAGGIELNVTKANGGLKKITAVVEDTVTFKFEIAVINKVLKTADDIVNILNFVEKYHEGVASRDGQPGFAYNAAFVLGNSIDLTGKEIAMKFTYAEWIIDDPDTDTYGLIGLFDGKGYTLYGGTYSAGGLLGRVGPGSIVKNLAIVNATQKGMNGPLGLSMENATIENVLIDIVDSQGYNSTPIAPFVGGDNMVLKNVVAYYPDNSNQNIYSFSWGGTATADNVYIISNMALGGTLNGKYATYAYGKTCSQIAFEGLPSDMWNLTGERATFKSLDGIWQSQVNAIEVAQEMKAGGAMTLSLPAGATFAVNNISSTLANDWVAVDGNTISISSEAYESFTFVVSLALNGATRDVTVNVDASKITVNTGINYDFDLSKKENLTYTFDGVTDGTLKVDFGAGEKSYAVSNGSVTIPYADASAKLGEVTCTLESGKYLYNAQITVVTKVITTAEELLNITDYTTKYNEGRSSRDNREGYAYDGYFVLGGNIDLTGKTIARTFTTSSWIISRDNGWTDAKFGLVGTFDGRGYTLYGGNYYNGGLFGEIANGTVVKNVAVVGATHNGGDGGVFGVTIAAGAKLQNVLVDIAAAQCYNSAPLAAYVSGDLENVVLYYPQNTSNNAFAVSWGCTLNTNNVYIISDQALGAQTINGSYVVKAYGSTCAQVGFTGLNEDLWVLTGDKATFKSTKAIVESYLNTIAMPNKIAAGSSETLSLPSTVSFSFANFSIEGAEALVSVKNSYEVVISADATEPFTFDIVLTSIYGGTRTVSVAVDCTKQYIDAGSYAFSLHEKQDTTYSFGEGVNGTLKVMVGDTVATYEVVDGSITVPYAHVSSLLGEYAFELEAGIRVYTGTFIVATKVINTADELLNITDYTTKYNEGKSSRDNREGYAYDGYFVLGGNIDLTGKTIARTFTTSSWIISRDNGWTDAKFGLVGTFDGRGYTLYGGNYYNGGLFGEIANGTVVKNVAVVGATHNGGDGGVFGVTIAAGAKLQNVLVDIAAAQCYNSAPLAAYVSGDLENVVLYYPQNTSNNAFAVSWGCTLNTNNVYIISDQALGAQTINGSYVVKAYGSTCAQVGFTGLNEDLWVLTGDKAMFKSTLEFLE